MEMKGDNIDIGKMGSSQTRQVSRPHAPSPFMGSSATSTHLGVTPRVDPCLFSRPTLHLGKKLVVDTLPICSGITQDPQIMIRGFEVKHCTASFDRTLDGQSNV